MKNDLVNYPTPVAPELILIGPTGAGKSTLGLLLADRLNLPSVSIDGVAEPYYSECNFGIVDLQLILDLFNACEKVDRLESFTSISTLRLSIEVHGKVKMRDRA